MSATIEAVKVTRKDFVSLCEELKMTAVRDDKNWPNARLLMKAKKLPSIIGESEPEISQEAKDTLDMILETLKGGGEIEFDGDVEKSKEFTKTETNGTVEGSTEEKPAKAPKEPKAPKVAKEPKEKKERKPGDPTKVDRYGCRLDAQTAKFNACISKSPKTMKEITQEAGLPVAKSGDYNWPHLARLVSVGLVTKTEDSKYHI